MRLIAIAVLGLLLGHIAGSPTRADAPTPTPRDLSRVGPQAFSEAVAKNILNSQADSMYQQMDTVFRRNATREQLRDLIDLTHRIAGRIRGLEFRTMAQGKRFAAGREMEFWKVWYAAQTAEAFANAFLWVEVVNDRGTYACSGFSLVTFPGGVPHGLVKE